MAEKQFNKLTASDWIQFLNTRISQRINFYYSQREFYGQRLILFVSILSIITIVFISIITMLDVESFYILGFDIILLIIIIYFIFRESDKINGEFKKYSNKAILTLSIYNQIIEDILKGKIKKSDDIQRAWEEAEQEIIKTDKL